MSAMQTHIQRRNHKTFTANKAIQVTVGQSSVFYLPPLSTMIFGNEEPNRIPEGTCDENMVNFMKHMNTIIRDRFRDRRVTHRRTSALPAPCAPHPSPPPN